MWRIWRAKLAAFCWQLLAPKCSLCATRLYLKRQYKHMSKPGRWRTRSLVFEREKWILVAAIAHEINWNKLANSKQNNGNTQQLETVPISSSNLTRWCYNCNADTRSKQAPTARIPSPPARIPLSLLASSESKIKQREHSDSEPPWKLELARRQTNWSLFGSLFITYAKLGDLHWSLWHVTTPKKQVGP